MNKDIVYVALLVALCVLAGVLVGAVITRQSMMPVPFPERQGFAERAEHEMGRFGPGPWGKGHHGDRLSGFAKMLTDKLSLSAEQQTKVKEILEATRQEIEVAGKQLRETMKGIKEKGDKAIMEVLTPQQQEKFTVLLAEMEKWREMRRAQRPHGPCGPGAE